MNEIEQLRKLINEYPKHYSKILQKNECLLNWVKVTSILKTDNIPEMVASILHNDTGYCEYGNKKKFNSINTGFRFCGPSNTCKCAHKSVSAKVSIAKSKRTKEQIKAENQKRINTSLEKYGVKNNGLLQTAKDNHKKLYSDRLLVTEISTQIKNTKKRNHGNPNFNNREKAKNTCKKKYGFDNPWLNRENNINPNLIYLYDKIELEKLYPTFSVHEIADKLKVHVQTVYRYLGIHSLKDPYQSSFEKEIIAYLKTLGIDNIITNTRSVIRKELDIFLPDHNLAIEYNGEYWHHDQIPHISKTYHYDKFKQCQEKNITLFTIFGNSWETKKQIWKNKIKSKLNLYSTKVFARNTSVVSLSSKETIKFLNNNHVQGYCISQIAYGLQHDNKIIAIMTFSKSRTGIGKNRGAGAYELVRYATSCPVIGGASKLLAAFKRQHSPNIIISYSDNQYSQGNLYKILGFQLENEISNGYWYYDPKTKKTYHRYKFTKHKLINEGFDPNKTEKQIMQERGFLRIYDCGTKTWKLDIK